MRPLFALILILALVVLSACTGNGAKESLNGSAWNLTSLNGTPPVGEAAPTLSFEKDTLGGSAGCNSFGGNYTVNGDKLAVSELISTMMACIDSKVMHQETVYLVALGKAQTFSIDGSSLHILSSDGVELVFTRQE
jgi:putative lipoprotein